MIILLLTLCNALLAAALMWVIAERRGSDRTAYAIIGFLLGPLALLLLLGEAAARRSTSRQVETVHQR